MDMNFDLYHTDTLSQSFNVLVYINHPGSRVQTHYGRNACVLTLKCQVLIEETANTFRFDTTEDRI